MRVFTILSLLAVAASSSVGESWISTLLENKLPSRPHEAFHHLLGKTTELVHAYQKENKGGEASAHPYFNFLPQFRTGIIEGTPASWSAKCFSSNTATSVTTSDTTVKISITSSDPSSDDCFDAYSFMTVTGKINCGSQSIVHIVVLYYHTCTFRY